MDLNIVLSLQPDASRVVARPFLPGPPSFAHAPNRLQHVLDRVLEMPAEVRLRLLDETLARTGSRFDDIESVWASHFEMGAVREPRFGSVEDPIARRLLGALLTQAYAYEAVSLTNPSMVPFGEPSEGKQPFVMSARAIGEGHISSIAFITGTVDSAARIELDRRHPHASNGRIDQPEFDREEFAAQLEDVDIGGTLSRRVLEPLPERFTARDLHTALSGLTETDIEPLEAFEATRRALWVAASNYRVEFRRDLPISEHLLSPVSPVESNGMEDARFVRFVDDDGSVTYYATYTAYDGRAVLPQLIRTTDFHEFDVSTLTGPAVAHQKGMALFPRRIDGDLVALSRHDQERLHVARTRDIKIWSNAEFVISPSFGWELVQIGNCGSPIETEAGWLVFTHGVGPMRRYVLGAVLLDLDDPARVLGRTAEPLIEPGDEELNGYVPDVVYSCGGMLHGETVILPYGYADYGIRIATFPLAGILNALA